MFYILPNALLPQFLNVSLSTASLITSIGISIHTIMLIPAGLLTRVIPAKKIMCFSACAILLLSYPMYVLLISEQFYKMILAEVLVAILLPCFVISSVLEIPKIFDYRVRVTGVSFGYNLGLCLLGGPAPMVSIYLIQVTQNITSAYFYLGMCCLLGLCSSIMIYRMLK